MTINMITKFMIQADENNSDVEMTGIKTEIKTTDEKSIEPTADLTASQGKLCGIRNTIELKMK